MPDASSGKPEEDIECPKMLLIDDLELPSGFWELNQCPLGAQINALNHLVISLAPCVAQWWAIKGQMESHLGQLPFGIQGHWPAQNVPSSSF